MVESTINAKHLVTSHRFFWLTTVLTLSLCACGVSHGAKTVDGKMRGLASYYGKSLHGRKTASGERFNMNDFTAAHRNLPFGTKVRVKNLENGKTVVVRINDRGPFVKGRIIDVSLRAAKALQMVKKGVVRVSITVIEEKPDRKP